MRVVLLVVALCVAFPQTALADTISASAYKQRLADIQQLLRGTLAAPVLDRGPAIQRAKASLRQTNAIALRSGSIAVDDGAIADRLDTTNQSITRALADLDALLALTDRATAPAIDAARADAALRDVLRDPHTTTASPSILDAALRALTRFFAGLQGPTPDLGLIWPLLGALGAAVIFYVVATLGRGFGERVRSEVALRETGIAGRIDPSAHLRSADDALASGHPRDAIHLLYLYALAELIAREAIRDDPALTDRELLVRAAAIPHAEALRDLVGLYERAWFGLREVATEDARRARALAMQVAA